MGLIGNLQAVVTFIVVSLVALLAYVILRLQKQRVLLNALPQPPSAGLFGRLKILGDITKEYPKELHPHSYLHIVRETYGLGDVFYMNAWPLGYPMLAISHPQIAEQALLQPKHESLSGYLSPITGAHSLIYMEGKEWKKWRSIFNPGFSHSHLMTLIPGIVEDSLVFCDILQEHARKADVFRLEELATRVTVDIIGRIVLDARFNAQRSNNPLLTAIKSQIKWCDSRQSLNPFIRFNPFRPLVLYLNSRKMEDYIGQILQQRLSERTRDTTSNIRRKHVTDLALEAYYTEEKQGMASGQRIIDSTFKRYATDQMKTFLFAGHDTTSSTICWCYHLLSKNREHLTLVLDEHRDIFGPDFEDTARLLREKPQLINKLEYTSAVIKESLRLFPAASSLRMGSKDFYLQDPKTGEKYPTNGFLVWLNHVSIHRNADLWDSPDEFRPQRFLGANPEGSKYKDSWRPFEKGPRACIGQELALIEAKVILALTMRKFDIKAAYNEMDKLANDGLDWPVPQSGIQKAFGEEAFQTLRGTAKPRQGMPARVTLRV